MARIQETKVESAQGTIGRNNWEVKKHWVTQAILFKMEERGNGKILRG